jgi:putative glycosyltransferase (TIGR04348 family)
LRIGIITPARAGSLHGNRVTALRWQHILRILGHKASLAHENAGLSYDLLVALHARRSYSAICRFHSKHPQAPLIVALTGTDLYHDVPRSRLAQRSLQMATRLIVLQPKALQELRPALRQKARVIYQSVSTEARPRGSGSEFPLRWSIRHTRRTFDVCVAGHLRAVKDPFRAALAARLLPANSRIRILHLGGALSREYATKARAEMKVNPRYRWLGERPRSYVFRVLRRSKLFVLSSRLEGGANALSEAICAGVPVLASRIPGNTGILGERYPGCFDVEDTRALAELLWRAETDSAFLARLQTRCDKLISLFDPRRESAAWSKLLGELTGQSSRQSG